MSFLNFFSHDDDDHSFDDDHYGDDDRHDNDDIQDAYQFTITDGAVTAVFEIENGRAEYERIEANESWSVDGTDVVKTEAEHGQLEISTYSDPDGDGLYALVSKAYQGAMPGDLPSTIEDDSFNHDDDDDHSFDDDHYGDDDRHDNDDIQDAYQFTITDGAVTAVFEIENGRAEYERIEANESWSVDGTDVVKTEAEHGQLEISTYSDPDGDGLYALVSKAYQGAMPGDLPSTIEDDSFNHDDDDHSFDDDHYGDDDRHDNDDIQDAYQFTITDGAVTAVFEIENGRAEYERIEANESWSVDGTDVVKTEAEHGQLEISTYSDPDGDGLYALDAAAFESVVEMYIAYFNRAPDAAGLNFWCTAHANGMSLEAISAEFATQPETLATYPEDTTNLEFVSDVYENVLGRVPDIDGLRFWADHLDDGSIGRGNFILAMLNGVQDGSLDRAYLDQKTDLGALFAVHRGMSNVDDASQVMALFTGSPESLTNAIDAVEVLYAAAMDTDAGDFLIPLVGVLDDSSLM